MGQSPRTRCIAQFSTVDFEQVFVSPGVLTLHVLIVVFNANLKTNLDQLFQRYSYYC